MSDTDNKCWRPPNASRENRPVHSPVPDQAVSPQVGRTRIEKKDFRSQRRALVTGSAALGALGIGVATLPFVESMKPSAKALALGSPVTTALSVIEPGKQITIPWRGRPIWVLHRTPEMIRNLTKSGVLAVLRDPNSSIALQQPDYARNATRSINPRYFVAIGLCTHLGCVPTISVTDAIQAGGRDYMQGYYCPCHGSRFDFAGRVIKGVPAPTNLVIPPHRYLNSTTVEIGVDHA